MADNAVDGHEPSSKCPKCEGALQEPRRLPCRHELCAQCFNKHTSTFLAADKTCPTCDKSNEVIEERPGSPAPVCVREEHRQASVFCCDCDKFFCKGCINDHQQCGWMSDHRLRPVDEMFPDEIEYAQSDKSRDTCQEHGLPLTIMCKVCKEMICAPCSIETHEGHQYLVESVAEKDLNTMTSETQKVIKKQTSVLGKAKKTKETVSKEVKGAKDSAEKAAEKICKTVRKYLNNFIDDLDRCEKEVVENLERIENNAGACKAKALSLQKEINSLLMYGKPTEKMKRALVLQEKFDAQEIQIEEETITWKYVCERRVMSDESVKSMLGDVELVTPRITLSYDDDNVTGMVAVGEILCVVHSKNPNVWLYSIPVSTDSSQSNSCRVPLLENPLGMAVVDPNKRTVVITDQNKKGGKLHFVKLSHDLKISQLSSKNIGIKHPGHISVSRDESELLIGQWGEPRFLVCDLQGNEQRQVTVTSPDEIERFPWGVERTANGYAALMRDKQYKSIIQWMGESGNCSHSYGQKDGEQIKQGQQLVRDNTDRLLLIDYQNHKVHIVDEDGHLAQFLITEADDILCPRCVYLDETTGRVYVAHGTIGSMEVRFYKWPPKSGEFCLWVNIPDFGTISTSDIIPSFDTQ